MAVVKTDEQARERRRQKFEARVRPVAAGDADFEGEKTIEVTYNGRQWHPLMLAPHEAKAVFELLKREFGLS